MTALEQIQVLQKLVLEYQEHNLKLIEENAQLRAKVAVPRDMQQEANLLARENNEEWVKREMAELKERAAFLEGELSAARERVEVLQEENGKYYGVLEFYSNPATYFGVSVVGDRPCGDFIEDIDETFDPDVEMKVRAPGAKARAALGLVDI